jgi:curved DNA-binding protein
LSHIFRQMARTLLEWTSRTTTKTLGLERTASDDEVRKAYRKLARKYHPDVSKEADAQARMRDINEANDVLRDKEKRAAYDALADRVRAAVGYAGAAGRGQFPGATGLG